MNPAPNPTAARGAYELARDAARTAADELRTTAAQLERLAHRSTGPMYDGRFTLLDTAAAHQLLAAAEQIHHRLRTAIATANANAPHCGMPPLQEVAP